MPDFWFSIFMFLSQNEIAVLDYYSRHSVFGMTEQECYDTRDRVLAADEAVHPQYYFMVTPCMKYDFEEPGLRKYLDNPQNPAKL